MVFIIHNAVITISHSYIRVDVSIIATATLPPVITSHWDNFLASLSWVNIYERSNYQLMDFNGQWNHWNANSISGWRMLRRMLQPWMWGGGGTGDEGQETEDGGRREGPHLIMAVVVMVEELCTFVIIGPGLICRGLLPRSVEVAATVRKSWATHTKKGATFKHLTDWTITSADYTASSSIKRPKGWTLGWRDWTSWNQREQPAGGQISTRISWFVSWKGAPGSDLLTLCRASLTFMVEVVDVLRTGGGHELPWRRFRPTNNAVPFRGAETICGGEKTSELTFKVGARERCSL